MKKEEIDETGETPKTALDHKDAVEKQEGDAQKPSTSKDMDKETKLNIVESSDCSEKAGGGKNIKKEESDETKHKEKILETKLDAALLHSEPIYAELCSFFNVFGTLLNMKPISFARLDKMFCTLHNGEVDGELIDLHIQMMRKIYLKSARADKWENSLVKFCSVSSSLESELLQLQRYSYSDLPFSIKLNMLKALCESQFDCNVKFKENLFNTFQTNEIRIAPIGVDRYGLSYYYQQDCELNIRVYTVEQDDQSGRTWNLKAKSEQELVFLIDLLKSPDFGKKRDDDAKEDEDTDEDQLINKNSMQNGELTICNSEQKPLPTAIQMTEEEKQSIKMSSKRCTFWDCYHDGSNLNMKKTAKELRKKEKEALVVQATSKGDEQDEYEETSKPENEDEKEVVKSNEDDQKNKKGESIDPDLEESLIALEERRVLPRRSARSNAINNLKAFTAPLKKGTTANMLTTPKVKKEPFRSEYIETEPVPFTSDEDELFDEEDQEDEESHSSDDEFNPDGHFPTTSTRLNTSQTSKKKAQKKGRRNGSQRQAGKPPTKSKSANASSQRRGNALIPVKNIHKAPVINFVDSSDEEEVEESLKERKKVTEKTLCMQCSSSKRPDLLLLCDMCDDAWHTWCLKPSLWFVPDGDWFCPKCQHSMLVQKLSLALVNLTEALKIKQSEEKKKQTVAERLKREMDFIGVSLNNIIPSNSCRTRNGYSSSQSDEEEEDDEEDDGQRKSKKKALRKVLGRKGRQERQRETQSKCYGPIMTIAEGRSRRTLTKVDYNFHAYDEQLQEAMETIDSSAKVKDEPTSGLGRGKDMANIIEEDRKRKVSVDTNSENNAPAVQLLPALPQPLNKRSPRQEDGLQGQPPRKKQKKKKQHKRLTDLDIDNATESDDTDEYKATSESDKSEEPEPSEDEYLPREFRRSGRTTRGGKTRSDEEFIDDNASSSSEYGAKVSKHKGRNYKRKASSGRNGWGKKGGRNGGKKVKRKPWESDEESSEAAHVSDYVSDQGSTDSGKKGRKKGGRPAAAARPFQSKWAPKATSSSEAEEDEEELEIPSGSSSEEEKTETGRPLRKAAVDMKKKMQDIEQQLSEESEQDDQCHTNKSQRPVGALTRPRRVVLSEDEAEFEPDEEEDEELSTEEKEVENKDGMAEEDEPPTLVKCTSLVHSPSKDLVINEKAQKVVEAEPLKEVHTPSEEKEPVVEMTLETKSALNAAQISDKHAPKPEQHAKVVQRIQRKTSSKLSKQLSQEESCLSPSTSHPPVSSSAVLPEVAHPSNCLPSNSPVSQGCSTAAAVNPPRGARRASQAGLSSPLHSPPPQLSYHPLLQANHPAVNMPVYSNFYDLSTINKPVMAAAPSIHPYAMNQQQAPYHHHHHQPSNQFRPSHMMYQTLQPYEQQMVDPRTGAIVDPESLGHALAGAMNPEDL